MKIKPIIFGSTGMIGQGVLRECLIDPEVESVLLVNRRPSGNKDPKIKEVIHKDFSDFSSLGNIVKDYNACFFSLGITSVGLSEEEYYKTTFELTIKVAEMLVRYNKNITFCYISGQGTDSSEKGKIMWARVKGKTENALLKMPFKNAYMIRPGYIQPRNGIRSRTKLYNIVYFFFTPLYYILKPFKSIVTDTRSLGKAMISLAKNGYNKMLIEVPDINKLANRD